MNTLNITVHMLEQTNRHSTDSNYHLWPIYTSFTLLILHPSYHQWNSIIGTLFPIQL